MLARIKRSLKFRLFYGYCRRLEKIKKTRRIELNLPNKFQKNFPPLFIVTCQNDIPLLRYSLHSLKKNSARIPAIWLVGDSDETTDELQKQFPPRGENLRVTHWNFFLKSLSKVEQRFVTSWEKSIPWGGYARKFAATIGANRTSAILLSDADVLWKRDFSRLENLITPNSAIIASQDHAYSYDKNVVSTLDFPEAPSKPPINCGFIYYAKNILERALTDEVFQRVDSFAANASTHLEQTLIAYAFHKMHGSYFPTDEIATTLTDNFRRKENVVSTVRHYAGAKHLFWRDA